MSDVSGCDCEQQLGVGHQLRQARPFCGPSMTRSYQGTSIHASISAPFRNQKPLCTADSPRPPLADAAAAARSSALGLEPALHCSPLCDFLLQPRSDASPECPLTVITSCVPSSHDKLLRCSRSSHPCPLLPERGSPNHTSHHVERCRSWHQLDDTHTLLCQ